MNDRGKEEARNMVRDSEFQGKKILVTGASSGIGLAVATYFLNCGAKVYMICQDVQRVKEICIKGGFDNAVIIGSDLAEDIRLYDIISHIQTESKKEDENNPSKLDIVVYCAGIKLDGDIEKTFPQEFDYTMDLNLRSIFVLTRYMIKYDLLTIGASVINLSCNYGTRPMPGLISYAMSKAGLEVFTRYAAAELAPQKIRVNAISACPVMTNSLRLVNVSEPEISYFNKQMEKNIPLGKIALPDDIAKAIVFLASQRSCKITGQIIKVDGGRSLTSSGYIHYRGCRNMNTRFEPDGYCMKENLNSMLKMFGKEEKTNLPAANASEDEIKKFVDEHIKQSNFSTKDTDAHQNAGAMYKRVKEHGNTLGRSTYGSAGRPTYMMGRSSAQK